MKLEYILNNIDLHKLISEAPKFPATKSEPQKISIKKYKIKEDNTRL